MSGTCLELRARIQASRSVGRPANAPLRWLSGSHAERGNQG